MNQFNSIWVLNLFIPSNLYLISVKKQQKKKKKRSLLSPKSNRWWVLKLHGTSTFEEEDILDPALEKQSERLFSWNLEREWSKTLQLDKWRNFQRNASPSAGSPGLLLRPGFCRLPTQHQTTDNEGLHRTFLQLAMRLTGVKTHIKRQDSTFESWHHEFNHVFDRSLKYSP